MSRAVLILSLGLALAGLASAATYVVQPDGTGDFATIALAVQGTEDGDIIELANGTFMGDGNRNHTIYNRSLTIRSQSGDPSTCIIDPEGGEGLTHRCINFQGTPSSCMIENITFTGGSALGTGSSSYGGAMMFWDDSAPTITGCVFVDNHAGRGGAIFTYDRCMANITGCTFANNTASSYGGAISMSVDSAPTIEDCTFYGNSADAYGGALSVWNAATPTITNCTFYGNSATDSGSAAWCRWAGSPVFVNTIIAFSTSGNAVSCEDVESNPAFSCCDIFGNAGGDWVDCIAGLDASDGNISADPLFTDAENQDFHLSAGSPCIPFSDPNPECDLIGAWVAGDTPVESSSWGWIKTGYRSTTK